MARRHYNINTDKPLPETWGEWEFEIDLTSLSPVNVLVCTIEDDGDIGSPTNKAGVIIDWGDGSETETIMGGEELNAWNIRHTFPSNTKYIINIKEVYYGGKRQERITRLYFQLQSVNCLSRLIKYKSSGITSLNYVCHNRTLFTGFSDDFKFETPNVTQATSMFYNCSSLIEFPTGVFDLLTKNTTFYYVFNNCTSLITVGNKLFNHNSLVTSYADLFYGCKSMTSSINEIFDEADLSEVNNVNNMFRNCNNATGSALDLIDEIPQIATHSSTFTNCTALSDYNSIPSTWR